ncbi:hypothetical protein G647_04771 [Cladophialophora carrionii CBS 160.54]|uniref:Myb-like domain-containing protein n=1 Tax=Cladophialophora carrionii CBS 160.54 TaxID=1279043 RepID=V9D7Z6_9EURO|nr:uncharacterized protein G647_04771 [Cladophialophora carrionii CBS 160.54]ETI22975.1 hypothetical protein G647_04771 [Cladophialophora carrionii CBS 160.54]
MEEQPEPSVAEQQQQQSFPSSKTLGKRTWDDFLVDTKENGSAVNVGASRKRQPPHMRPQHPELTPFGTPQDYFQFPPVTGPQYYQPAPLTAPQQYDQFSSALPPQHPPSRAPQSEQFTLGREPLFEKFLIDTEPLDTTSTALDFDETDPDTAPPHEAVDAETVMLRAFTQVVHRLEDSSNMRAVRDTIIGAFPEYEAEINALLDEEWPSIEKCYEMQSKYDEKWKEFCVNECELSGRPENELCEPSGVLCAGVLIQLNHPTFDCVKLPEKVLEHPAQTIARLVAMGISAENCLVFDTYSRREAVREQNGKRTELTVPDYYSDELKSVHQEFAEWLWVNSAGKVLLLAGKLNHNRFKQRISMLRHVQLEERVSVQCGLLWNGKKLCKIVVQIHHPEYVNRTPDYQAVYNVIFDFAFSLCRLRLDNPLVSHDDDGKVQQKLGAFFVRIPRSTDWRADEDTTLRLLIANRTMKVAEMASFLPGRTASSIQARICVLKLGAPRSPKWTDEEDAKLKRLREAGTAFEDLHGEFPGRYLSNIKARARELGIQGIFSPWTEEEDAKLKKLYGTGIQYDAMATNFPGRSATALAGRAQSLGITKEANTPWTDAEEAKLRQLSKTKMTYDEMAEQFPGRTGPALSARAFQLGISRRQKHVPWTDEEDSRLRKFHADGVENKDMVEHFPGRNRDMIRTRMTKLGLRKKATFKRWTPEQDEELKKRWPDKSQSWSDMEEFFGKEKFSLRNRARALGLANVAGRR